MKGNGNAPIGSADKADDSVIGKVASGLDLFSTLSGLPGNRLLLRPDFPRLSFTAPPRSFTFSGSPEIALAGPPGIVDKKISFFVLLPFPPSPSCRTGSAWQGGRGAGSPPPLSPTPANLVRPPCAATRRGRGQRCRQDFSGAGAACSPRCAPGQGSGEVPSLFVQPLPERSRPQGGPIPRRRTLATEPRPTAAR